MNKFVALIAALVMVVAGFTFSTSATAADKCVPSPASTETIVHEAVTHQELDTPGSPAVDPIPAVPAVPAVDAVAAQHYSWTGGNLDTDNPPTEVPPSDNWQANTAQEPHLNGGGNSATWVGTVGVGLHYTANSDQHASWFYFTPAVEGTPEIPGSPFVPGKPAVEPTFKTVIDKAGFTETIEHPAVTCETPDTPSDSNEPKSDEPTTVNHSTPKVNSVEKGHKATVSVPTEIESGL